MPYDKKTGTITIASDDPKEFERDLLAHMSHVTEQVDKELAGRTSMSNANNPVETKTSTGGPVKWIAIALNVGLICAVLYMVLVKGDSVRDQDLFLVALFIGAPAFSLWSLASMSEANWFGLYLKRKALEERKRIKALESE